MICAIIVIVLQLSIIKLGKSSVNQIIHFFSFELNISSFQGIISALIMLCYILMVFIHYEYGPLVAYSFISLTLLHNIVGIVRTHELYSLPGILSSLTSVISISIIYYFYKRSSLRGYTDLITGVRNRRSFVEEVSAKIQSKKPFKLACIEIEDFKHINDIYGIQTGDYILQNTANQLQSIIGKKDKLFKITGATFAVVFDGENDFNTEISKIIQPENIVLPKIDGDEDDYARTCLITLAAGVAVYPDDSADSTTLLKHADIALTNAKKMDKNKLCIYSSELESGEIKQKEAEFLINEALANDYFYLVFQPQFTLNEKKLRGFETLIRCKKPDGSIVSPAVFIPAAEKSNLILKIDDYVMRRAMAEFKPILEKNGNNCTISINVSAKNMSHVDFVQRVQSILNVIEFPPQCLEIEITEYSFSESMETTVENIKKLRELGVQVALDDFGTGYTSIAQLMKLPINLLKIDKSLIDDIESDHMIQDFVDSVIYMGHIMNCEVISEGVESEKQLSVLREHNCDFVQGFVWGKPLAFEDAIALF
ncbi:MAG: bifunctional diguanylate cyclase/phosphodiesterase [Treponema sp.]|nr:bifunctional diguanylate cyclase/phosphodiesterase [Treponema sp.]